MLEETEAERIVALGEQSTAPFAAFLEAAPDAIVVVDRAGRITMVNGLAERMFGYERQEMLAQWVAMLVPERFRQGHVRPRQQYLAVPRTRSRGAGQALTGLKKDGAEFPIEISLSSLRTDQGTQVVSI
ncbi:MAG TPA: PAS domain S-box protein, partial [Bacillota bacterium]|nr:PAS domain S-box protein [Bacillota bacterium]